MLAMPGESPFSGPEWLFEPKLDGVRVIAEVRNSRVRLLSRRGLDTTEQFPEIASPLAEQPEAEMILDGEIVALGESGAPSFGHLQERLGLVGGHTIRAAAGNVPAYCYMFDLLYLL